MIKLKELDFDEAFDFTLREGKAPKGYRLDKRKLRKAEKSFLGREDAIEFALVKKKKRLGRR